MVSVLSALDRSFSTIIFTLLHASCLGSRAKISVEASTTLCTHIANGIGG